jgi:putative transposase
MPIRTVPFVPGEFYHIYNRGNSRQVIYRTTANYERFVALLYLANSTGPFTFRDVDSDGLFEFERGEQLVSIGAYCLMPNHFHILLTPVVDDGVVLFMRKLSTGYSMYFNKKHHRTGSLFEGRFKSEHVNSDRYLKYLFSYIHLNPVKLVQPNWQQGIVNSSDTLEYLKQFKYSSYFDNCHTRPASAILNQKPFPDYFQSNLEYDREMVEWLQYTKD